MLNEDEIIELLRGNQRDHLLRDDERERIRSALLAKERRQAKVTDPTNADDVDVSVLPGTGGRPARRTPLILLAAALLLVAGVGSLLLGGDDQTVSTVAGPTDADAQAAADERLEPTPLPTPDPRLAGLAEGQALCSGPFAALTEALAAWDGIDNWSYLTDARNPEPHLPTLAFDLLDALEAIDGETTLEPERNELAAALRDTEQLEGFTPQKRVRIVDALTALIDGTRRAIELDGEEGFLRFSTCDLTALRSDG